MPLLVAEVSAVRLRVILATLGNDFLHFDLRHMVSDGIEVALHGHRAERELALIATLEEFGHSIVEIPKILASEFVMARLAELNEYILQLALGEHLGINETHQQVRGL